MAFGHDLCKFTLLNATNLVMKRPYKIIDTQEYDCPREFHLTIKKQ